MYFGLNPIAFDQAGAPHVGLIRNDGSSSKTLTFRRRINPGDPVADIETSADMVDWGPPDPALLQLDSQLIGDGIEEVVLGLPEGIDQIFIRFRAGP
ncbi:MAG: hypothetical protein R3F11_24015 [Verrucomicrobiales bacterium]